MSELHEYLNLKEAKAFNGKIDLYEQITIIKDSAKDWLSDLGKNGYEHSERLEGYLDILTKKLRENEKITPDEVFILLCAVYMHDIGYRCDDGTIKPKGHQKRSQKMILANPSKYHFGDFPSFDGKYSRAAEAVGLVCYGHSMDVPLEEINDDFPDQVFETNSLNLRKLTALLRMADEADDPYIRYTPSQPTIRDKIPLVEITEENIIWHWDRVRENDPFVFQRRIEEKQSVLESSVKYLSGIEAGRWYMVLDPQVTMSIPFMAEKPVETFVGRQNDLESLHEKILRRGEGAVTGVSGAGGIGKTELAKLYAKTYKKEYPGGVFWASLKGSTWREEAVKLIVAVSHTGQTSKSFPDDQHAVEYILKNILVRKDALLIIDNVEEGDDIIKPGCYVLVTTRNTSTFGLVPRGTIYNLSGLSVDEGKKLLSKFIEPQRIANDPGGALRLVEHLGGLPLAIDIAAQHLSEVPDLSFPEYIGRIQNKIDELKIKDDPDKNVHSTLELSLEQLEKIENGKDLLLLFEGASVCAESGFTSLTLGETAGVGDGDRMKIQELVAKLSRRSLLEFNKDSNRYSMHPLLRQIAENRLHNNSGREKEFKRNHCLVFLHYLEAHDDEPDALVHEKDGIWQALIQAGQLDGADSMRQQFIELLSKPYWNLIDNGLYQEAFAYLTSINLINIDSIGEVTTLSSLLDPLLENLSELDLFSQRWVLTSKGIAYVNLGEYRKAIGLFEKALEIARRFGDVCGEGKSLVNMGLSYANLGEYKKAIELYEKALEMARRIGDASSEGAGLGNLGLAYANLGEYRKAIVLYEKVLEMARRIGDASSEGAGLSNMGTAHLNLGEYKKAIGLCEKALKIHRRLGNVHGEGVALSNMGTAHLNLGEYKKAIELCEKALKIHRRIGDAYGEGVALSNMGSAYANLEEYMNAIELYEKALKIDRRIGDVRGEGNVLTNMGIAYASFGEYRKAIGLYEKALEIARRSGDVCGEGADLGSMGLAYSNLGDKDRAYQCVNEAKNIFEKMGLEHMISKLDTIKKIIDSKFE